MDNNNTPQGYFWQQTDVESDCATQLANNVQSERALKYVTNPVYCGAIMQGCGNFGGPTVPLTSSFGGVYNCCGSNKLGNVESSNNLRIQPTRMNYLEPAYTEALNPPFMGRGWGFYDKVPIDSQYIREQGNTRDKRACDVLAGVQINRFEYLPCDYSKHYVQTVDQEYGVNTRNARRVLGGESAFSKSIN